MSYRLALRGHRPVAVDIAHRRSRRIRRRAALSDACRLRRVQRRFRSASVRRTRTFDAVIYNASLHYSSDYLADACRSAALPAAGRANRDSRFAGVPVARARRDDAARAAREFCARSTGPNRIISAASSIWTRPRSLTLVARDRDRVAHSQAVVRLRVAFASAQGLVERVRDRRRDSGFLKGIDQDDSSFFNPRATRKGNQRYPLSILALAAMIEGREDYAIVDGNIDDDPAWRWRRFMRERPARMLAVTVMPGPQTRSRRSGVQVVQGNLSRRADRVGRIFSVALSGRGAECELRRFCRCAGRARRRSLNCWRRSRASGRKVRRHPRAFLQRSISG